MLCQVGNSYHIWQIQTAIQFLVVFFTVFICLYVFFLATTSWWIKIYIITNISVVFLLTLDASVDFQTATVRSAWALWELDTCNLQDLKFRFTLLIGSESSKIRKILFKVFSLFVYAQWPPSGRICHWSIVGNIRQISFTRFVTYRIESSQTARSRPPLRLPITWIRPC